MADKHYPDIDPNPDFPKLEEQVLAFWKAEHLFEKSVDKNPTSLPPACGDASLTPPACGDSSLTPPACGGGKGGVSLHTEKKREEKESPSPVPMDTLTPALSRKREGEMSNEFIFYDGPPFANGLPHYGHLLTGYVKDLFARYQTMKGKRVERRFGWDCHGLPAEMGAEKELGISGRQQITNYGIGKFNDYCRTSVMKYTQEWEHYVTRQGRWVDFENDYKTMDKSFMESVLWAFKQLHDKGLIYEAYRVMPYSWAAETPLSNFETRLDNSYRERTDKAITVAFELIPPAAGGEFPTPLAGTDFLPTPLAGGARGGCPSSTQHPEDEGHPPPNLPPQAGGGAKPPADGGAIWDKLPKADKYYVLAWTTTPWTLPSNLALAVNKEIPYTAFVVDKKCYIVATGKLDIILQSVLKIAADDLSGRAIFPGRDLINLTYTPLFPYFADRAHRHPERSEGSQSQPDSSPSAQNDKGAFRILDGSDFVTDTDGTGIVHLAPGFGEDDQRVCEANGISVVCPVDHAGRYTEEVFDIPSAPAESPLPPTCGDSSLTSPACGGFSLTPPACGGGKGGVSLHTEKRGGMAQGVNNKDFTTRKPATIENAKALRKNQTDAEKKLWQALRQKQLENYKFRRQQPIGDYIVDFVCMNKKLVIELDGGQHNDDKQKQYDDARTAYLQQAGYEVLRFWNHEVFENLDGIAEVILRKLEPSLFNDSTVGRDTPTQPSPASGGGLLSLRGLNVIADTRKSPEEPYTDKQLQQYGLANLRIVSYLKSTGQLIAQEDYVHNYPHCWRTDQPLIYRALPSWYVEVTKFRDRMVELNQQINWIPGHVRDGLFGKWLEGARDWSISRNRFWGMPIPVWRREDSGGRDQDSAIKVFGSIAELEAFFDLDACLPDTPNPRITDLHRPFIDQLTIARDGSKWRRVEDVFDCWFESGSMPFGSQWAEIRNRKPEVGNRNEDDALPDSDFRLLASDFRFPADFIVEYMAQTRGWFYTMMVLSTALFDQPPFKNCICHGVVLDDKGQKLSKRLNNYADPVELFNQFGADALRWFMMSSPVMRGAEMQIDPEGRFIRDVVRLSIKPIWNAYNFFCLYANADGIVADGGWRVADSSNGELPATRYPLPTTRYPLPTHVMDRYILAKCAQAVTAIEAALDAYDTPAACEAIGQFFETLNNWYIRRSKERFWSENTDADPSSPEGLRRTSKQAAYDTLYTVLHTMCRAAAPLLPFTAEVIYQGLHGNAVNLSSSKSSLFPTPLAGGARGGCPSSTQHPEEDRHPPPNLPPQAGGGVKPAVNGGECNSKDFNSIGLKAEDSVHLADFPTIPALAAGSGEGELIQQMDRVRDVCNAALSVRNACNIRVRQPLALLTIISKSPIPEDFMSIVEEEINVKATRITNDFDGVATLKLSLNNPVLGKRLPTMMKQIIPAAKKGEWKQLADGRVEVAGEQLLPGEFTLQLEPKPEYKDRAAALSTNDALVILDTDITPELEAEGLARDLVRAIQQARKDAGLHVSDHINLTLSGEARITAAARTYETYIAEQTLADSIAYEKSATAPPFSCDITIDTASIHIGLAKAA